MSGSPPALAPAPTGRRAIHELVAPTAVAATLALIALAQGWRGRDLPAQVFRADLVRHYGFVLWDDMWFGGHPTLDYSVLAPVLGALTGPIVLGGLASVASAVCFDRLLRAHFGRVAAVASFWFALSTATNIAVGRITYSLGIAFALAAALAIQRSRPVLATLLALLCALSSPVAAVFLAIGVVAWASRSAARRRTAAFVIAATVAPLIFIAVAFPSQGTYPFSAWALFWDLLLCAAVLVAAPRDEVVLRRGTVLFALVNIAVFVVPNPLGGNITRLAQYGAGPLLACVMWPARRRLLLLIALPLLFWQWSPAMDGIAFAAHDPSTDASFYTPLLTVLKQYADGPQRLEIPITLHHWESVYVAATQPLARGWERQLDIALNPIFYDGTLSAATYGRWLSDQGVGYVALPAAPLDPASQGEAQLLSTPLPYLAPVWHDANWQLWRVTIGPGLVSGHASLTALGPASFTVNVTAVGDVVVRVRQSEHWAIDGRGCVADDPSGWTRLHDLPLGTTTVSQALRGTKCPGEN